MQFEQRANGRFYDCTTRIDITDTLTEYLRIRAAKVRGGRAKTEAKRRASRLNGAKNTGRKRGPAEAC